MHNHPRLCIWLAIYFSSVPISLFIQAYLAGMMTSSNGNIFRVAGHLCGEFTGRRPVAGEFPAQRPVTRGFDVCFDLRLNKRVSKQSCSWLFETLPRLLWRHSNGYRGNHTIANEATLQNMGKHRISSVTIFGKDSSITPTKKSDIKH